MIDWLRPSSGTSAARGYAGGIADFWSGLSGTLRALDTIAADPRRLDEEVVGALRTLQYRLHWSSELLDGLRPPAGTQGAHDELRDALVDARDATGELVEAIEAAGPDGAAELLYEWRGTLFRVRLARIRLGDRSEPADDRAPRRSTAASATGLALLGAAAFLAGAALGLWPLWGAGLALIAGALAVQRT